MPEARKNQEMFPRLIVETSILKLIDDILYQQFTTDENIHYSVDDICFSLKFWSPEKGIELNEKCSTIQCDGIPVFNETNKANNWRYFWSFEIGGSSVRLGIGWNSSQGKTFYEKGMLQFNPNKVGGTKEIELLLVKVAKFLKLFELKRFDIAVDIPVKRLNTRLQRDKRGYEFIDHGRGVTEYLGTRNKPGRIKLYDKTRESNLAEDYTRLELTCSGDWDISEIKAMFPSVYAWDDSKHDYKTRDWVRALGLALARLIDYSEPVDPYLSMLSYKARNKVLEFLSSPCIVLNDTALEHVMNQVCKWSKKLEA
jgi:hypothetical protein